MKKYIELAVTSKQRDDVQEQLIKTALQMAEVGVTPITRVKSKYLRVCNSTEPTFHAVERLLLKAPLRGSLAICTYRGCCPFEQPFAQRLPSSSSRAMPKRGANSMPKALRLVRSSSIVGA